MGNFGGLQDLKEVDFVPAPKTVMRLDSESVSLVAILLAVAVKISNSLICFCSFDLSCPILENDSFIENVYILLSCLIK